MDETINVVLMVILAVIIPLVTSYYFYSRRFELIQRSRPFKTFLIAVLWALALDFVSFVLWCFGLYVGFTLMFIRLYVILVAVPFFYHSTIYWDSEHIDQDNTKKLISIHLVGLIIGIAAGMLIIQIKLFGDVAAVLGPMTSLPGLVLIVPDFWHKWHLLIQ